MYKDQQLIFKDFFDLCKSVEGYFDREWKNAPEWEREERLQKEKMAIMGYTKEMEAYKEEIRVILREMNLDRSIYLPPWYNSLEEGVFAELYGLAGLTPWAYDQTPEYAKSQSAKLIGERLYCLVDGKSVLQQQRISKDRREQLKRALLLASPRERIEKGFHEIYLRNGIRISIFSGERTKDNQDVMVFRKYILNELTFEKIAELETIPAGSVELFKTMVKLGFNVMFSGQVRAGKTSFMQCWQRYEDESLEGLAIATDPETSWHKLMPNAPIMQISSALLIFSLKIFADTIAEKTITPPDTIGNCTEAGILDATFKWRKFPVCAAIPIATILRKTEGTKAFFISALIIF